MIIHVSSFVLCDFIQQFSSFRVSFWSRLGTRGEMSPICDHMQSSFDIHRWFRGSDYLFLTQELRSGISFGVVRFVLWLSCNYHFQYFLRLPTGEQAPFSVFRVFRQSRLRFTRLRLRLRYTRKRVRVADSVAWGRGGGRGEALQAAKSGPWHILDVFHYLCDERT